MTHISQIIAEMSEEWKENAGIETPDAILLLTNKQDGRKIDQSGNGEYEKDQSMAFRS